ncbi:MAG: hypothetical protein QM708_03060 [Propioniciclava sp.]|uniref:uridine kinase family protein n=1 Tax=Propioniciclava sp. TaxID=2038686 RepID=UPI0039E41AFA
MKLLPEEPAVAVWRAILVEELWQSIRDRASDRSPLIVAVDGRGASGKSTLAARFATFVPGLVVVHTDDLAWNEPLFDWFHLLREDILAPLRRGEDVWFTPPAWPAHGRDGAIVVPASAPVVVIEGVGAAHDSASAFLDATIWVQSDHVEAERRGIERDLACGVNGDRDETIAFWHEWWNAERAYLAEDRPWERADLIVAGTPPEPLAAGEVAVADGPLNQA